MKSTGLKFLAILECLLIVFVAVPWLSQAILLLVPGVEDWLVDGIGFAFPIIPQVLFMALTLLLVTLRRRDFASYGLSFKPLRYHLDIAGACLFPFLLAGVPLGIGLDYRTWSGALLLAALNVGLLFLLGWLLRKKPTAPSLAMVGGLLVAPGLFNAAPGNPGNPLAVFLTYAFFVGFGEEMIYRGYVQSRLNEVFDKPFRFFGVQLGWGLLLSALIFGLTHAGFMALAVGRPFPASWAWGFWTFFGGLVSGFIREKSGSILAPALLHGLPQAIGTVAMLYMG